MDDDTATDDLRDRLAAAGAEAREAAALLDEKRKALRPLFAEAATKGLPPSEVEALTGYSRDGTRKALRRAGAPPAKQGRRPHAASGAGTATNP